MKTAPVEELELVVKICIRFKREHCFLPNSTCPENLAKHAGCLNSSIIYTLLGFEVVNMKMLRARLWELAILLQTMAVATGKGHVRPLFTMSRCAKRIRSFTYAEPQILTSVGECQLASPPATSEDQTKPFQL